jgi:hypothetical protein
MTKYRGKVQLGDDGPVVEVEINNLDTPTWEAEPQGAGVIPGSTEEGDVMVRLVDGPRAGQTAEATLTLSGSEPVAMLVGLSAFGTEDANQAAARTLRQATEGK